MSKENNNENKTSDFSIYLDADSYDEAIIEESKQDAKTETAQEKSDETTVDDPVLTQADEETKKENKIIVWWKKRSNLQKTIFIILLVVILIIAGSGIYVWSKLEMIDTDGEDSFSSSEEDDFDPSQMNSITDADSLNDLLIKWATNGGEKMKSKYVKNILLIGKDSTSSLADSMILVSVNENTKQLSMVSFYRDSYTYIAPKGKKAGFGKLNAAYSKGGANCLIETIENNYKIVIDDYALVDYNSFPKVINALGGVDVNVTAKEANYINATWRNWTRTGKAPNTFFAGINHLNGDDALMFCRVRKLDSDIGRTERQRRVISSIMNTFKNANISQMNSAINALLPNINTGMSKTEIIGYATDAVSGGWLKFPINQSTMPTMDTAKGGFLGDQWVWICDYEGAAYQLQLLLYGKSNIEMSDDRVSPIVIKPTTATNNTTTQKQKPNNNTTLSTSKTENSNNLKETTKPDEETTAEQSTGVTENTTTESQVSVEETSSAENE